MDVRVTDTEHVADLPQAAEHVEERDGSGRPRGTPQIWRMALAHDLAPSMDIAAGNCTHRGAASGRGFLACRDGHRDDLGTLTGSYLIDLHPRM